MKFACMCVREVGRAVCGGSAEITGKQKENSQREAEGWLTLERRGKLGSEGV